MAIHKFHAGQKVELVSWLHERYAPTGEYVIVRQLPVEQGEFCYRIRHPEEPHDRVVKESLLRNVKDP
jgi:hypothetical protein